MRGGILLAELVVTTMIYAPIMPAQTTRAQVGGGLGIELFQEGVTPSMQRFRLELHNAGSTGIIIDLGTSWSQGRVGSLTAFHYMLRMPTGRVVELRSPEPANSFGAPAPEPLLTLLPAGSTLTLPVNLAQMELQQGDAADWRVKLAPGRYLFWVTYRHEMPVTRVKGPAVLPAPFQPFWVGELTTGKIRFDVP